MSKEYIEREPLEEYFTKLPRFVLHKEDAAAAVATAPAADVEEVKTGQWVTKYNEHGYHKECSVCGARWMLDSQKHICIETPRCYNCGAKLKKEESDENNQD